MREHFEIFHLTRIDVIDDNNNDKKWSLMSCTVSIINDNKKMWEN